MDPFRVEVHCSCGLRYRVFAPLSSAAPSVVELHCPRCDDVLERRTEGTVEGGALAYTVIDEKA